jgi:L-lysine exporter family protein LysE/ArgO
VTLTTTLLPALLGLGTGLALIIAIGAQNAYLLRLGIEGRNRVVLPAVLVCALSDAVLIAVGVLGIGAIIRGAPVALVVIRVIGSGFLIVYGIVAAARAVRPKTLEPTDAPVQVSLRAAVGTMIALTWLNPHVYLDTVIFLGSVANQQGVDERWWWAGGAVTGSFVWFFGLGFGARLLRPFFAKPSTWRILDAFIAVLMLFLGIRMAVGF